MTKETFFVICMTKQMYSIQDGSFYKRLKSEIKTKTLTLSFEVSI